MINSPSKTVLCAFEVQIQPWLGLRNHGLGSSSGGFRLKLRFQVTNTHALSSETVAQSSVPCVSKYPPSALVSPYGGSRKAQKRVHQQLSSESTSGRLISGV
ncbi:hypothetical protein ABBQ32_003637 [Trebouxia sp. C0010 RCD-2024]